MPINNNWGGQGQYGDQGYQPQSEPWDQRDGPHQYTPSGPNGQSGYWQAGGDTGPNGYSQRTWHNAPDAWYQAKGLADKDNQLMGRMGPVMEQSDLTNSLNSRNQQREALGMLQQSAQGNGPSVAQAQTYGAMGNNIAAMNAGAQGHGANVAGGMGAGNQALANTAMQGANARSQEQAGIMGAYGNAAAGLNRSDIGQYGSSLQQLSRARDLENQQGILNAQTAYGMNSAEMNRNIEKQSYLQQTGQLGDEQTANDWKNALAVAGTAAAATSAAVGIGGLMA